MVGGLVVIGGAGLAFRHSGSAAAAGGSPRRQLPGELTVTPDNTALDPLNSGVANDVTKTSSAKRDVPTGSARPKEPVRNTAMPKPQPVDESASVGDAEVPVPHDTAEPDLPQPKLQSAAAPGGPASSDETAPAVPVHPGASDEKILAVLNAPHPALPSSPPARAVSEVTPARLIHSVKPDYPSSARAGKFQGPVLLRLKVDASGRVRKITVLKGNPILAQSAVAAVEQWLYEPFKLNGKPVDGEMSVTVNFSLNQ